jgi:hypothetical protein
LMVSARDNSFQHHPPFGAVLNTTRATQQGPPLRCLCTGPLPAAPPSSPCPLALLNPCCQPSSTQPQLVPPARALPQQQVMYRLMYKPQMAADDVRRRKVPGGLYCCGGYSGVAGRAGGRRRGPLTGCRWYIARGVGSGGMSSRFLTTQRRTSSSTRSR